MELIFTQADLFRERNSNSCRSRHVTAIRVTAANSFSSRMQDSG